MIDNPFVTNGYVGPEYLVNSSYCDTIRKAVRTVIDKSSGVD